MNITLEQLYDYMNCPLRYYFKTVNNIPETNTSIDEKFREALYSTIKNFYYSLMDSTLLTPKELKYRWEVIWRECVADEEKRMKYNTKAMAILMAFHEWALNNCGIPIEIDRSFIINLGHNRLQGELGIVRQSKDDKIDILSTKLWTNSIDDFRIDTDIEYIINFMAFNSIYEVELETNTILLLKDMKELKLNRNSDNYSRAVKVINAVCSSIEKEIYYPRWNIYCSNCSYKEFCIKWK